MEKADLLQQIALFKELTSADLEKLDKIATEATFRKGQRIFTEGSPGDSLYVINSGLIKVFKKGRVEDEEVVSLSRGQHFGEMSLIDGGPRSTTVEAVEDTKLIQINREDLENLLETDLGFMRRIYRTIAKYLCLRLRQTTKDFALTSETAKELKYYISQY